MTDPTIDENRSRIVGATGGRVRKLSGFRSGHRVPDGHHEAAAAFLRRIGHEEVKAVADSIHRDLRAAFGFKRKDMDYNCADGSARIQTPHFGVAVGIGQDPDDLKAYRIRTEVAELRTPALAADGAFHACFNPHCDTVVVEFPRSIDVEAKIDRIEAIPDLADALDYAPDGSQFELRLAGIGLHIEADAETMHLRLLGPRNLAKLLEQSQKALDILAAAGLGARLSITP